MYMYYLFKRILLYFNKNLFYTHMYYYNSFKISNIQMNYKNEIKALQFYILDHAIQFYGKNRYCEIVYQNILKIKFTGDNFKIFYFDLDHKKVHILTFKSDQAFHIFKKIIIKYNILYNV